MGLKRHNKKHEVPVDFEKKLFDIKEEPMPKGAWWWWFWLFFIDNPKYPARPRQLMILWSTKNVKSIKCNDLDINISLPLNRKCLDGAVAAWYFDGEKMHHNYLLEQCNLVVSDKSLVSDSKIPTSFEIVNKVSTINIGESMKFIASIDEGHEFKEPTYTANNYVKDKGYSIIRGNRFKLSGEIEGEKVSGTAYFQRVFVTAPAVPWYWGIFHFKKGGHPYIF